MLLKYHNVNKNCYSISEKTQFVNACIKLPRYQHMQIYIAIIFCSNHCCIGTFRKFNQDRDQGRTTKNSLYRKSRKIKTLQIKSKLTYMRDFAKFASKG